MSWHGGGVRWRLRGESRRRAETEKKRVPPLREDPIRYLAPFEVKNFVEEQLFPRSADILDALDDSDRRCASLLLTSLTRFLVEDAAETEKNLPALLEMLNCCAPNYSLRHSQEDGIAYMMRSRAEREREFGDSWKGSSLMRCYMDYQRFHIICRHQRRVIESCRVMVYDQMEALGCVPGGADMEPLCELDLSGGSDSEADEEDTL